MDVDVWSRHADSTTALVDLGATAYDDAPDAVKDAEVVITMLPTAEATADVMFGGGVIERHGDPKRHGSRWPPSGSRRPRGWPPRPGPGGRT